MELIALLSIFVPFIGTLFIFVLPQLRIESTLEVNGGVASYAYKDNNNLVRSLCQFGAGIATLLSVLLAFQFYSSGMVPITIDIVSLGNTLLFGLVIDKVSTLILVAVVAIGFVVVMYSQAYMSQDNKEHAQVATPRYYAFLLAFIGAMAGVVLSSTILGQLLFFEITGACSWALISYYQTNKAGSSALKALVVTHIGSLGLFIAAASLFVSTGTFELAAIAKLSPEMKVFVLFGILFAAWAKSAQLPLHMWLPDAMNAPTPISAYLHAASMVKVGVYIFARAILGADGVPEVVAYIGIFGATVTMLYGFLMYLPQKDMKRLLAYSTIAQLAYIFLALSVAALGSDLAFESAVTYIFNHAFAKCLLFLIAGALSYACGTRMLNEIRGLLKGSPVLAVGFCIGAMTIAGVPPLAVFFSKFPMFMAGFSLIDTHPILAAILGIALIESLGTFAWLLYWFGKTVIGEPSENVSSMMPLPMVMKTTLIALMVMCFLSSFIASSWLS
ncbi:hydrogenase 4 subunit D [Vibrio variabilis]|uniref:hydrogenase 4 subunit D n=1 Tax=Vibrio variabilis TaxID=990271 RepID=UPI000DD7FF4B|nr:hydrogenase 4 subunit D [Vibrio variabilis]